MTDRDFRDLLVKSLDISKSKASDIIKKVRHPQSSVRDFVRNTKLNTNIEEKKPEDDIIDKKENIGNTKKYINKILHSDKKL